MFCHGHRAADGNESWWNKQLGEGACHITNRNDSCNVPFPLQSLHESPHLCPRKGQTNFSVLGRVFNLKVLQDHDIIYYEELYELLLSFSMGLQYNSIRTASITLCDKHTSWLALTANTDFPFPNSFGALSCSSLLFLIVWLRNKEWGDGENYTFAGGRRVAPF